VIRLLEKIPPRYRRSLYSLPLLIHWIIGLTWERDPEIRQVARRSMLLSFIFLIPLGLFFFLSELALSFAPGFDLFIQWTQFAVHALWSTAFLGITLFLGYREFFNKSLPLALLDQMALRLEEIAGY